MTYETSAVRKDPEFTAFSAAPVGGCIGADIEGIDLSTPLSDTAKQELREALLHYHVIFAHGQTLTPAQHRDLALVFGSVQMGGTIPRHDEVPEVKVQEYTNYAKVSGDVNMHADDTFKEIPSKCSLLYGVDMPPSGGDTIWVNTEAAYMALSEPLRQMLDQLTAVHDLAANFGLNSWGNPDHKVRQQIEEHYPPVEHPVVSVHPETGRRSLFINEMVTTRINGIAEDESRVLLEFLINHLKKPIFQVRLHWPKTGTLAIWDNRSSQHLILPDFQPQYRKNHRVAIEGESRPVGPSQKLRSAA